MGEKIIYIIPRFAGVYTGGEMMDRITPEIIAMWAIAIGLWVMVIGVVVLSLAKIASNFYDNLFYKPKAEIWLNEKYIAEQIASERNVLLYDVLSEAMTTIYLNDRSDYLSALWTIIRKIDPCAANLLETDEAAAIKKYTNLRTCKVDES